MGDRKSGTLILVKKTEDKLSHAALIFSWEDNKIVDILKTSL
jgi:hypothetical protein